MAKSEQFEALNALRGVAALGVAVFHFRPTWPGYLAVDFFFVLSGFILAHGYFFSGRSVSFRLFFIHRLARLYPLHLFSLVVFALVYWLLHSSLPSYPLNNYALLQQLLLVNNLGFGGDGLTFNEPSWSISVELYVNIVFFLFFAFRWGVLLLGFLGMLGLAMLFGHLDVHYQNLFGIFNAGLIRCLFSFALGLSAYQLFLWIKGKPIGRGTAGVAEVSVLALVLFVFFVRQSKLSLLDFAAPIVFVGVVVVFAREAGWFSTRLCKLNFVGDISYSLYLNQFVVLLLVREFCDGMWWVPMFFVYMGSLLSVSYITYMCVEQPARNYLRTKFDPVKSA